MAHRTIGQEQLGFASAARGCASLDAVSGLIDWSAIAVLLAPIHASAKGELAWPPLAMFKSLLLSVWYDLSDVRLAETLDDRASFRRFCGFSSSEPTPERTAFVRFRRALVAAQLDRALFAAVTAQLKAKAVTVKTGTIVDATIIASASTGDGDASWVKHKNKPAVHGFKAHVGADADSSLVEEVLVTPANVNDGKVGDGALPNHPGEVFADSAYRGTRFGDAVRSKGGIPRVVATGLWGRDEQATLARLAAFNAPIHRVRARIEKIFGTWKRSYGLRRMRWFGIAKAAVQIHLTAIAYNLKRSSTIAPSTREAIAPFAEAPSATSPRQHPRP
jgi:transposase, IS5 family